MAKHSAPSQTNWGQRIVVLVVALLVVVGGLVVAGLLRSGDDAPSEAAGDGAPGTAPATVTNDVAATGVATGDEGDAATATAAAGLTDCTTPVTVWAAPQLEPAVEAASERTGSDCFEVASQGDAAAQAALGGGELPDVWIPGSEAWPRLAAAEGVELQVGETIASSPVLLVGAPQVVAALEGMGIGPDTTWAQLVEQYQQMAASGAPAPVTLRVGDPRVDAATMSLLSGTGTQPGGWAEPESAGRGMLVILAHTAIQDDPLSVIASDPTTLVPATEQQLGAAQAEGASLAGLALQDGLGVVRMPFVRVGDGTDDASQQEAVDALEEQLTSAAAADDLQELWLRPGTDGPAPGVTGVPEGIAATGAEVDPAAVALTAETWAVISPQSHILTLIDISGSMEAPVGDTTRIDLTREAAQTALQFVPPRTGVGVWYFATALDGDQDYVEVAPLRPLGEQVNGVTQRELLLSVTEDLGLDTLTGDTGLHDSLWAAYEHMQQEQTPDAINSVLLLTDGIQNDTTGGLSEEEVINRLTAAREAADRPVIVVLIGMGPEVDEAALNRLATAAGGASLVIRDPRELPQVFVDIVARRAS